MLFRLSVGIITYMVLLIMEKQCTSLTRVLVLLVIVCCQASHGGDDFIKYPYLGLDNYAGPAVYTLPKQDECTTTCGNGLLECEIQGMAFELAFCVV